MDTPATAQTRAAELRRDLGLLLEQEIERLERGPAAERLTARLALLCWDLEHDADAARRRLIDAEAFEPLAALHLQLLLDDQEPEGAAELLVGAATNASPTLRGDLLLTAALLQLLWLQNAPAAAVTCEKALRDGELPAEHRQQLDQLRQLGLAVGEAHAEIAALAEQEGASLGLLVLAALSCSDILGRPQQAVDLALRALEIDEGDPLLFELLLELEQQRASRLPRVELLERKLALLDRHSKPTPEALAVAYELGRLRLTAGELEHAGELLERIDHTVGGETTLPQMPSPSAWARHLLLNARRNIAAQRADRSALATLYLALCEVSGVPALTRVYRLRAAHLLLATRPDDAAIEVLLQRNLEENPTDEHSALLLEQRLLRQGEMDRLAALYEQQAAALPERKPLLLRCAALVAEVYLGDHQLAASLRRDGLAARHDACGAGDLQRLYRGLGATPRLIASYRHAADHAASSEQTALWHGQAAVLQLAVGDVDEATDSVDEALAADPEDLLALALKATILRGHSLVEELRTVLLRLIEASAAPENRVSWLRELASLTVDPSTARKYLERAQSILPDDLSTTLALAGVCELEGHFDEAVTLRRRIAQQATDDDDRVRAWLVAGRLLRQKLQDATGAIEAFDAALAIDPAAEEAIAELCALYEEEERYHDLVEVLGRQLELDADDAARAATRRRLGDTHHELGAIDEALACYADALEHVPTDDDTLRAVHRVCRAEHRWDFLEQLLATLPQTSTTLDYRAEALEQLDQLPQLAEVRALLLGLATAGPERADRAYDVGRVFERLDQHDLACQHYQDALEALPGHRPSLGALQRIYHASGQVEALIAVLEQELAWVTVPQQRVDLLAEIAGCLEQLGDRTAAAIRLEEVVEHDPQHRDALDALERLYGAERPLDLARLLVQRADAEPKLEPRAEHLVRAAALLADHGEHEESGEAYRKALEADPTNRDAFFGYESYCYENQLWREALELYEQIIGVEEERQLNAYRLSDLYSRRGQLQRKHLAQPGEAAASLLKALEHDPKSESVMKMLTGVFAQQQDWLGLIKAYEHRASLVPDNELFQLEALRQAARLARLRLSPSSPVTTRLWQRVRGLDPADDEALSALHESYRERELFDRLAEVLEARIERGASAERMVEMQLELGRLCEGELDDPERAARAYENLRKIDEHHEEALKALARIYEATARWDDCITVLNHLVLLEADPDERSLLYFKCGSILEARFGDEEQAIAHYRRSLEEAAGCLPSIHGLRDIFTRQQRWDDALETLELELQQWDDVREQAGVLARMGQLRLQEMNDASGAMEHFLDALAVDADCQPALLALFDHNFEQGQHHRALELADKLVPRLAKEGDPEQRSRFYCRRGLLLAGIDELQSAAESLVVALELRPTNIEALDALVTLCRRAPEAYDFAATFRRLEQVYRRESNPRAVAHVLVAAGTLAELAGDADAALERFHEAIETAPAELAPVSSAANLLARLRRSDEAAQLFERYVERSEQRRDTITAMFQLGEVFGDVQMNAERAAQVYRQILEMEPTQIGAHFRLAQELNAVDRGEEAHELLEAMLALPGWDDRPAADRARHRHYLGVVLLGLDDTSAALGQFRRALQLDPCCGEAALALARQLALAGDRAGADELLGHTIHEISVQRDPAETLELRRSRAGLALGDGDEQRAIGEYEALLAEGLARDEDRLALAEIYAREDEGLPRALAETNGVLDRDAFNPHAFALLARLFELTGEGDRTAQVLQVLELFGLAGDADRGKLAELRAVHPWTPRRAVDGRLRRLLAVPQLDPHVERLWHLVREPLQRIFPAEIGEETAPATERGTAEFQRAVETCLMLFPGDARVLVGRQVPGGVVAEDGAQQRVVVDELLVNHSAAEVRFALGHAFGLISTGHASVGRLAFDDRQLLIELLAGLLQPAPERSDLAEEFLRRVGADAVQQVDDVAAAYHDEHAAGADPDDPARWLDHVDRTASHYGLLAADSITDALRMVALLSGQDLAVDAEGNVALRSIAQGSELVRFFLSDRYIRLRRRLIAS